MSWSKNQSYSYQQFLLYLEKELRNPQKAREILKQFLVNESTGSLDGNHIGHNDGKINLDEFNYLEKTLKRTNFGDDEGLFERTRNNWSNVGELAKKDEKPINDHNNTSEIIPTTVTEFRNHSAIERNNYNLGFTQIPIKYLEQAKYDKEFDGKIEEQKIIDHIVKEADNNDDGYIQSEELKQYRNNLGSNNKTFQETALDKVTEYMIHNGEHKLPSFVDYQKDTSVTVPSEIQELSPSDIFAFGETQSNNTELKLPKDLPQESLEQYAIVKAMGLKVSPMALNNTQDAIFCIEMAWRRALTLQAAKENPKLPIIAVYDKFGGGNTHGTIVSSLIQGGGALALNYGVEEFSSAKEIENSPSKTHYSPLPNVADEIVLLQRQKYNIVGFNLSASERVWIAVLKEDRNYYLTKYGVDVNKIKDDGSNLSEYRSFFKLLSKDTQLKKNDQVPCTHNLHKKLLILLRIIQFKSL